jgi:hypothetical protein
VTGPSDTSVAVTKLRTSLDIALSVDIFTIPWLILPLDIPRASCNWGNLQVTPPGDVFYESIQFLCVYFMSENCR